MAHKRGGREGRTPRSYALQERYARPIVAGTTSWEQLIREGAVTEHEARTIGRYIREDGVMPARSGCRTIMVIGDPHAKPDRDLGRFDALGRMVVEIDPDVVVCVGDWVDCHSVGRFDRGTVKGEGARLVRDIEAGNEALRRFHRQIDDHAAAHPEQARNPRMVFCVGNHEARIESYTNSHPELDGLIGLDVLDFARRGWEVVPFTAYAESDGVFFTHYVQTKMGKAKAGIHLAYGIGQEKHRSLVVGHSHGFDYRLRTDHAMGLDERQLVAGCYFSDWEDYAGQNNDTWWRGICLLRDVHDGRYDLEQWDLTRILKRWGE